MQLLSAVFVTLMAASSVFGKSGKTDIVSTKRKIAPLGFGLSENGFSHDAGDLYPASVNDQTYPHPIKWHGGAVLQNVEVHTIFWGNVQYQKELEQFYRSITNSAHMDWLSEYNVNGYKFGRGKLAGSYNVPGTGTVDPNSIVKAVLDANPGIKYNGNSYFVVHYQAGAQSCSGYCAYHQFLSYKGVKVAVGMMPDCANKCYDPTSPLNALMCISAHELIEAVTDPYLDAYDGEIGDVCYNRCGDVVDADGNKFVAQYEWSNSRNGCILTNKNLPTVPPTITTATTATTPTTTTVPTMTTTTNTPNTNTKTTTTKSFTKTTTKTTTNGGGAISNGKACSSFGQWACNNGCQCVYTTGNTLSWFCSNGASC